MKIVNVNVIVVKDITMIKLKTLLVEQENKYPADAPEHFGGGKNILTKLQRMKRRKMMSKCKCCENCQCECNCCQGHNND